MQTKYHLLLCIANKDIRFNNVVPVFSRFGRISTISAEHLGALTKKFKKLAPLDDQKVIIIDLPNSEISKMEIEIEAAAFSFALNYFMQQPGIVIDRAFVMKKVKVSSAVSMHYISTASTSEATEKEKYRLQPDAKPVDIEKLLEYTKNSLQKDPTMVLTINKYNSAMGKYSDEEKIIDISICMESVFPSTTEIAFKFALYHAICSATEKTDIYERFKLLKDLYTARSKIVHGNDPKKHVDKIVERWTELCKICALSIFYKMQFLQKGIPKDWQEHLDGLALGLKTVEWDDGA